jgi:PAS domain S-box-containing protein
MVNRSYLDFLGVDPEDVVGRRDQEIFPEDISGKWSESDDKVLEGKKVFKTLQLTKDRRYFDVRKFPVPLMDGEIGIGGVVRDITRRKSAERDLKESERRFKTLISNIPGMVYRCDYSPKWPLIFVSRGSINLLGLKPEKLTEDGGVSYNDFIHPDDRDMVREKILEAIEEGEQFSIEYRVRDKSGKERWVLEKGVGIRDKNEKVRFFEGIITDITKSKIAEDKVKEEMNRAEFYLDLLGHDIGNLHQGILTGLELATRFDDQNVKDTGLSSADSLIRKSLLMVKQVQTLSKLKNKEPEPKVVDLKNTFRDYQRRFDVLFPEKAIEIRMEWPKHPVRIMAEPVIDALFFNLVHNAIKFHDGKDAVVEIKIEDGDVVKVTIADHGRGIPDELKDKIFGKFETFGQKGRVGLGLSLVNTLIDRYNGSIEVKDRVEGDHTKGSRFVMSFPTI